MCIRDRCRTCLNQLRKLRSLENKHRLETDIVCKHTFHPRIMNLTKINFNDNEMVLLNKGLNYNLPPTGKIKHIYELVEAEAAIKTIPKPLLQKEARILINIKFTRSITS